MPQQLKEHKQFYTKTNQVILGAPSSQGIRQGDVQILPKY